MADPSTIGAISLAGSGLGSLISGFGEKKASDATAKMYGYKAGIADLNRLVALNNRDYSLTTGDLEAQRYGMKARQVGGSIIAKQGASGIDLGTGSSVDVQKGHQYVTALDMATIRNNAARKAFNYQVEAETAGLQSQMYKAAAKDTKAAGNIKLAGSLISGATSVSSKWLQGNQVGLW